MKKNIVIALALCALLSSCEEFTPVFTSKYPEPSRNEDVSGSQVVKPGDITVTHTIQELSKLYTQGHPMEIEDDIVIAGRVISTDKPGNFYNQIYIQDETGGIEIKLGKNSLYNEYKLGQKVYVVCGPGNRTGGLSIGSYGYKSGNYGGNGMTQLGAAFAQGTYGTAYETSYIRSDRVIKDHIYVESPLDAEPQTPVVLTEKDLPAKDATLSTCRYLGRLVTLKGLKYANQAFALLYLSSDESNKNSQNRVFLSDQTWGIDSWAMSKANFLTHLQRGDWDAAKIGNANDQTYGSVGSVDLKYLMQADEPFYQNVMELKDPAFCRSVYFWVYGVYPEKEEDQSLVEERMKPENLVKMWPRYCLAQNANGYAVSQYFTLGSTTIQLRTSGFAKFADSKIPASVLNGSKSVSLTGILTLYQGNVQFIVNSLDDIVVE